MVQLLIVDDEVHVVERFSTTVNWAEIGIEQVHKAFSADEALLVLEQNSVDIVITDIQMPGMNGLQLIAEIKKRWPKTKCILLSGYSDFSYAQEAIHYKTEDYLLKPVTEKDLLDTVKLVMEKLQMEWQEVVSNQRLTYTLNENLPMLRGNLLKDLLHGFKLSESLLSNKLEMFGLAGYQGRPFAFMMIRLEEYFLQYDLQSLSLMEYAISNMVEELFGDRYDSWYTKDELDYLVFVMKLKQDVLVQEESNWVERTAALLQSAVHTYLKGKVSVLVSEGQVFPGELTSLYNQSIAAFRRRIGSEQELFMRLNNVQELPEIRSLQSLYEPPTLIHLLEAARWEHIEEKLQRTFEELEQHTVESQENLLEAYFSIASAFTYIAHKNGRQLSSLIDEHYDKMIEGLPYRSVKQLQSWSMRTLQKIKEDMDRETKTSRESLINDIRKFIELNIASDVSLQSIASHVFLHPVYVSKIYKLETGENLSDYVNRVRMDKAEYMLKNSQEKIYEIAEKLGYQRPHSFNHSFKKQYGMTPQEYRDQYTQVR